MTVLPVAVGLTPAAAEPATGSDTTPQTMPPDPPVQGAADRGAAARSVPEERLPDVVAEPAERTAGPAHEIAFAARLTDQTTAASPARAVALPTAAAGAAEVAPAPQAPLTEPAFEAAQPARAAEVQAVVPGRRAGAQLAEKSVVTAPENEAPARIESTTPAALRVEASVTPGTPAAPERAIPREPAAAREPAWRDAAGRAAEKPAQRPPSLSEADAGAAPLSQQADSAARRSSQSARETSTSEPACRTEAGTPAAPGSVPAAKAVAPARSVPESQESPAVHRDPGAKPAPTQEVLARYTPADGATASTQQPRTSEEKPSAAREARPAAMIPAVAPHHPQASEAPAPARDEAPARPATVEVPEPDAPPSEPVRDIALKVGGQEQKIEIRMAERAGEIRVSVHAPEGQLRRDLQEHLPELVRDLDRQGFAAETWRPAEPASRSDTAGSGTHEPPGRGANQGDPQQDGRGRRNRPQPQWIEEMVRTTGAEPERNTWQQ